MTSPIHEDQVDRQGNSPIIDNSSTFRSHETIPPHVQPSTSNRGIDPVNNDQKAPIEGTGTPAADPRSRVSCKFYGISKNGCRAGESCPFLHAPQPRVARIASTETTQSDSSNCLSRGEPQSRPHNAKVAKSAQQNTKAPRTIVSKPVPYAQQVDPRGFQVKQVERRFSPAVSQTEHGTTLAITLVPSDPDFPFELDALRCTLTVPIDYLKAAARPSIKVTNPEIERGYAINVERGFDAIASAQPARTLLSMLNELDKNLQEFLTAPKVPTIKFVAPSSNKEPEKDVKSHGIVQVPEQKPHVTAPVTQPTPRYSEKQKLEARSKRDSDIRQLEARLRSIPQFSKSSDGLSFTVPLSIRRPDTLPAPMQSIKEVTLFVPLLYNFEPCTIKIRGLEGADVEYVEYVELAFERHARKEPALTLMAHVNYLSQNLHVMAKVPDIPSISANTQKTSATALATNVAPAAQVHATDIRDFHVDDDKPHVHVIPRPIEWDQEPDGSDDEDSSDFDSEEHDDFEGTEDEADEGGAALPIASSTKAPTGNSILLSFPDIELYGIELLEVASLDLTLKCERCKSHIDARKIKATTGDVVTKVSESCPKCAIIVSASFTSEPLHANSIKAGHLDLHGCTVADMLPSMFNPTCSGCSTTHLAPPGVVSVRGETTLAICRSCHQKMTFKIPEVKFLRVSSALASSLPLRQKKKKENLGLVSGTPLPAFGKCQHYRKSKRWFRFSCCGKVFPCDRCHEAQAEPKHVVEHANRMICGYCSREQNYRPEDCGVCHESLVGRRGGGFWEGGEGTRDKSRMSRKDPRKYRRLGVQVRKNL